MVGGDCSLVHEPELPMIDDSCQPAAPRAPGWVSTRRNKCVVEIQTFSMPVQRSCCGPYKFRARRRARDGARQTTPQSLTIDSQVRFFQVYLRRDAAISNCGAATLRRVAVGAFTGTSPALLALGRSYSAAYEAHADLICLGRLRASCGFSWGFLGRPKAVQRATGGRPRPRGANKQTKEIVCF